MAKNIASNETFGIIPGDFSAASSSPLWSIFLAMVYLVTGPEPWVPAWRRKWSAAFALELGMSLPGIAFAAYSLAHGGFALPNSLMLKGNLAGAGEIKAIRMLMENQYMLVLCALLFAAAGIPIFGRKSEHEQLSWLPVSLIMMILIHLQLAKLGWFYRYEGYPITLGLIAAPPCCRHCGNG